MLPTTSSRSRAHRRFRVIALIVPVLLFLVLAGVQLALLPVLPGRVAIHWDLVGRADGEAPAFLLAVLTLLVGAGLTVLIGVAALQTARSGRAARLRGAAALIWFEVGLLGMTFALPTVAHIGATGPVDLPSVGGIVLGGVLVGLLLALFAFAVTVDVEADADRGDEARTTTLALAPEERAAWLETVTIGRPGQIVLGGSMLLLIGVVAATLVADVLVSGRPSAAAWITLALAAACGVLVATTLVAHVRIDTQGLRVRSTLGWPRVHIPLAEIAHVEVVDVAPLGEFGGWGWRSGIGAGSGCVMRAGEGVRVTRTHGKKFTVTVDDAATAAALLQAYSERTPR